MAVRQEVHEALDELTHLGDPDTIEILLTEDQQLVFTLDQAVHNDEYPPISNRLLQEHISRDHHGIFIQLAARVGAPVPFRRP